jgi:hypothetical protein
MMVANDKTDNDLTADRTAQLKALRDEWLDQMTLAQRRVGTPGRIFWREAPAEFFLAPIEVRR